MIPTMRTDFQTEIQAAWYAEDPEYGAMAEDLALLRNFEDFRFGSYDWGFQQTEARTAGFKSNVAAEIQRVMKDFYIGNPQNIFLLEGPNGTGKNHLAWALIRWLAVNRGYTTIEHVYFPEWADHKMRNMIEEDDVNWAASILFLDDLDSGAAISASTQNPWILRTLLANLRPRVDIGKVLTICTLNTGLHMLENKFVVDSRGQPVEQARNLARGVVSTLDRAGFGRAIFYGREYRSILQQRQPGRVSLNAEDYGFWGRL